MENNLQQTEIGKIPEEWKIAKIKDIGEVVTGTTPSTKIKDYWGGSIPFVTPTDFKVSKYVHETERCVTFIGARQGRIIPKDAVMVTCIASVGEVALSVQECITNQQINTIICRNDINSQYIYYTIVTRKNDLKRWAGITTSPIIKKSMFEKFPLSLPPLPEQRKIAEILSTVDEAIEKVNEAIEKTERLKKGLMQQLLTKGIGHTEFKKTELGRIPKEWDVVRLGELFSVETGTTPSTKVRTFWDGGMINWFTPTDLSESTHDIYIAESERKITNDAVKQVSMTMLPEKSLILSTRAPVGYIAVLLKKATFNQGCKGLVPKSFTAVHPEFYCYYLQNKRYTLQMQSGGSTFKELTKERIENFRVPKISMREQREMTEVLRWIDKHQGLLHKRKHRFAAIKKGLMSDLLTGKRRVAI